MVKSAIKESSHEISKILIPGAYKLLKIKSTKSSSICYPINSLAHTGSPNKHRFSISNSISEDRN